MQVGSKERLDGCIQRTQGVSKTRAQNMVRTGRVFINGVVVKKCGFKVDISTDALEVMQDDQHIKNPPSNNNSSGSQSGNGEVQYPTVQVLYRDEDLLLLDKPAGILVHSDTNGLNTVVGQLLDSGEALSSVDKRRPGIVHRLDKATTGLMLVCRTTAAHTVLQEQFERHRVRKTYLAIVGGRKLVQGQHFEVELNIKRHPSNTTKMMTSKADGKPSKTLFKVLATATLTNDRAQPHFALVQARPLSGRTHQIRVHLASGNQTPIVGDPIYGTSQIDNSIGLSDLMLVAVALSFVHPTNGQPVDFMLPQLPDHMRAACQLLGFDVSSMHSLVN